MNQIRVRLDYGKGREFEGDLIEEMLINIPSINEELSTQPAKFVWWAALEVLAKDAFQAYEGEAAQKLRQVGPGEKLPSEKKIESLLLMDEKYMRLKKEWGMLKAMREASESRKEMLISLAANLRGEKDSNLKVMQGKADQMVRESRKKIKEE